MPNLHETEKEKGKNEELKGKPKKQKPADSATLRLPQPKDGETFFNGSDKSESSDVILISASSPSSSDSELPSIALKNAPTSRDISEKATQSKVKAARKSTALGTGMASSNVARALKTARKSTALGASGKGGMLSGKGGMPSGKAVRKSVMPAIGVSSNKTARQKGGTMGSNTNPIVVEDDKSMSSTNHSLTASRKKHPSPKKHSMTLHHDKHTPPKRRKKHLSSDASTSSVSNDIELQGSSSASSASASQLTESAKVSDKGPNKLAKKQSIAKFAQGKPPKNTALESPKTMASHKPVTSKKLDSKKPESGTNAHLSSNNKRSSLPIQKSFGERSSVPSPSAKSRLPSSLKSPRSPVNNEIVPPHRAFPNAKKMKSPSLSPPPVPTSQRLGSSSPPHKAFFPVRTRSPSLTSPQLPPPPPPPPLTLYKLGSATSRKHSASLIKSPPPSTLPSVPKLDPVTTMCPSKLIVLAAKNKLSPPTQRPTTTLGFLSPTQQPSCSSIAVPIAIATKNSLGFSSPTQQPSCSPIAVPIAIATKNSLGFSSPTQQPSCSSIAVPIAVTTKTPLLAEPPDVLEDVPVSKIAKCQSSSVQQKNLHSSKTDNTLHVPQPSVTKKSKVNLESSQHSVNAKKLSEYSTPGASLPLFPGQSVEACAAKFAAGGASVSRDSASLSNHLCSQFEDNSTSDWSSVASDTETVSSASSGGPLFSPRLVHRPIVKKRRQTARKSTGGFIRKKMTPSRKFYLRVSKIKVRLKDSSKRNSESSQLPQQKEAKNPLPPKMERSSQYPSAASQSTLPPTRKRKLSRCSSTLSICPDTNSTNTPKRTKFQPGGGTSEMAISNVGSDDAVTMVMKKSKLSDQASSNLAVAPSQATSLSDNLATTKPKPEDLATTKPIPSSSDLCSTARPPSSDSDSTARQPSSDSDSTARPSVPAISTGDGSYSSTSVATKVMGPLDSDQRIVPSERDRELDKSTGLVPEISEESDFNPSDSCEIDSEMETTCARTTPFGCYPVLSESLGSCARTRPFCPSSFAVDSTVTPIQTPIVPRSPSPTGFSSDFQLQMDTASSSSPSDSESGVRTPVKRLLSAPLATDESDKKQETVSLGLIQSNDKANSEVENSEQTAKDSAVTAETLPAKERATEKPTAKEGTAEEHATEKPTAKEGTAEEHATEKPTAKEGTAEEHATEKPTAKEGTAEEQNVEELTAKEQRTDMELTVNGQTAAKQTSQEPTAEERTATERALVSEASNTHDNQMVLTSDATSWRKDNEKKQQVTKNGSVPLLSTSEQKAQRHTQKDTPRANRFRLPLLLYHPKISLINNTSERSLRDNYTSSPESSSSFVSAHSTLRSEQCSSRFYSPFSTPSSASFMTARSTPTPEDEIETPRPVQSTPIPEEESKTPRLMSPQEEEYKLRLQDTIAKLAHGDSELNEPLLSPSSR